MYSYSRGIEKILTLGNGFLAMTPKAQTIKEKIEKQDYIKLKNFCVSKDTINRVKDNLQNWEKNVQVIYLKRS